MTKSDRKSSEPVRRIGVLGKSIFSNVRVRIPMPRNVTASNSEIDHVDGDGRSIFPSTQLRIPMPSSKGARLATDSTALGMLSPELAAIRDLESQANLLVASAKIEAVRFGKDDHGFEVVASEVKSLAQQTARASKDITRQIEDIARQTEVVRATNKATTAEMADAVKATLVEISKITEAIVASVEEQGEHPIVFDHRGPDVVVRIRNVVSEGPDSQELLAAAASLQEESKRLREELNGFLAAKQAG